MGLGCKGSSEPCTTRNQRSLPLEYTSIHRGLSKSSLLRLPLGLVIIGLTMVAFFWTMGQIFPNSTGDDLPIPFSILTLLAFFSGILMAVVVIPRILPGVPVEQLLFRDSRLEWKITEKGKTRIQAFDATGLVLVKKRFDTLVLETENGKNLTVHRHWHIKDKTPDLEADYCELHIQSGYAVMSGFKKSGNEVHPVGIVQSAKPDTPNT